jgi:hypothetical protein
LAAIGSLQGIIMASTPKWTSTAAPRIGISGHHNMNLAQRAFIDAVHHSEDPQPLPCVSWSKARTLDEWKE